MKRAYSQMGPGDRLFKVARTNRGTSLGLLARKRQFKRTARINRGLNRRGVASQETGFVDLAEASYPCDTTGTITLLATIPQGASVSQRVGKKVMLKSIQARGYVQNNSAASFNDIAILVVYDKRPTGSLPAITDILTSASSAAMNNDANSGRFRILKRMDFALCGAQATSNGDGQASSADFYLSLKGLPSVFKAAGTGAIGDIEQGALYLITVGMNAAGTTAAVSRFVFRTRYIDV